MDENGVFSTTHLLSVSYPLVLPPPPPSSSSRVSRRYARSGSSELSGDEMGDGNIRTLAEWHGGRGKEKEYVGHGTSVGGSDQVSSYTSTHTGWSIRLYTIFC